MAKKIKLNIIFLSFLTIIFSCNREIFDDTLNHKTYSKEELIKKAKGSFATSGKKQQDNTNIMFYWSKTQMVSSATLQSIETPILLSGGLIALDPEIVRQSTFISKLNNSWSSLLFYINQNEDPVHLILTYLPEDNSLSKGSVQINNIKENKFSGTVQYSFIDGSFYQILQFKDGKVVKKSKITTIDNDYTHQLLSKTLKMSVKQYQSFLNTKSTTKYKLAMDAPQPPLPSGKCGTYWPIFQQEICVGIPEPTVEPDFSSEEPDWSQFEGDPACPYIISSWEFQESPCYDDTETEACTTDEDLFYICDQNPVEQPGGGGEGSAYTPKKDCAGIWNGKAYTDNCFRCVGGTTGLLPCVEIKNKITNPCLKQMVNNILSKNIEFEAGVSLQSIFGINTSFNLTFTESTNLPNSTGGIAIGEQTSIDGNVEKLNVEIQLNVKTLPNASQEYIAMVIIHEAVHAHLYAKGIIGDPWPFGDHANAQHEIMWVNYVSFISNYLVENFGTSLKDANSLAMEGLHRTMGSKLNDKIYLAINSKAKEPISDERARINTKYKLGQSGTKCNN